MKKILLLLSLSMLAACAPPAKERSFSEPRADFGPQRKDVDLGLTRKALTTASLEWADEVPAAAFFRMQENLLEISRGHQPLRPGLKAWTRKWWTARPVTRRPFADGPYAQLIVDQSEKSAGETLTRTLARIDRDRDLLVRELKGAKPALPSDGASLEAWVKALFDFITEFEASVEKKDLEPAFRKVLLSELRKEHRRMEDVLNGTLASFRKAKTLLAALDVVEGALKSEKAVLEKDNVKRLAEARALAKANASFKDDKGALSVLVRVWRMLTPAERRGTFRDLNQDFYDYMSERDEDDLRCLADEECPLFSLTSAAKVLVILPKLRDFGLENLRAKVDAGGIASLTTEVSRTARAKISQIGPILAGDVEKRVNDNLAELRELDRDFNGTLRQRLAAWAKTADGGRALTSSRLRAGRVKASLRNGESSVEFQPSETDDIETQGAALSLSVRLASEKWLPDSEARSWFAGEFDRIANRGRITGTVGAKAHAEILRGLSRLTVPLRDYEPTVVDELFAGASARQLFPKLDVEQLNRDLFPKDALYALSLEKLGNELNFVTTPGTPVFMVDIDGKVEWLSQFDFNGDPRAAMAGVVDRDGAARETVVRSDGVARYLLALCEFLRNTADVERSASSYLRVETDGQMPMERLADGRKKLKLLAVALANYLTHQMRRGDGLIAAALNLQDQKAREGGASLLDQALALRALVDVSDVLGIELYRWEALDLLAAMNARLFSRELGFYAETAGGGRASLPVFIETMRALDAVEPHLPAPRRDQVRKIKNAWLPRLTELFAVENGEER